VIIVSPALAEANTGNWHTAARWARLLRNHFRTRILLHWQGEPHDILIALHAGRSAASIAAHAQHLPATPRIVVLTGTDLYRDIHCDADARLSLELATRLVVLNDQGPQALSEAHRAKCDVVLQSATALRPAAKPAQRLHAVMAGHLRIEKDPLTFLRCAERLAARADIRFEHIGAVLEATLGDAVRATAERCPHYAWRGELTRTQTRQRILRAHVLVNTSAMEGGAQVVIEAITSGTPVIVSRIAGHVGLVGADWPALFEAGDDAGLAALVERARDEPAFLRRLHDHARAVAPRFTPEAETAALLHSIHSALETRA
jgi:putative glycosyltransferase (TIGR04348 family)